MSTLRRLEEAKVAYQRVIEIDPRDTTALAFTGVVYHLLDDIDAAIVKYHEVGVAVIRDNISLLTVSQALAIDPINGHVLELLELALEASADQGPFGKKGPPGGEDNWAAKMREHRDKGKSTAPKGALGAVHQQPVDVEMHVG